MKFTNQQVLDFLKSAGIANAELVEDEAQSTYNLDEALKVVDDNRIVVIKPKIIDDIHKAEKGRQGGILRGLLAKKTNISRKILDDLENDEEAIQTALQFREEKYSADSKTMREDLDKIATTHNAAIEELKQAHEKELAIATQKYISRDIDEFIVSKLDKKTLPDGADKKKIAGIIKAALANDVDLTYDEAERKALTFTKGTQNAALNKAKSNAFDWDEAIDDILTPLGLLRKDMRNENASEHMNDKGHQYLSQNQNVPVGGNGDLANYTKAVQEGLEKLSGK